VEEKQERRVGVAILNRVGRVGFTENESVTQISREWDSRESVSARALRHKCVWCV
jgi:hypothetical protein